MSTHVSDLPAALPDLEVRGPLSVPARLAGRYVAALRQRHPGASPAQLLHVLEKQFLLTMSVATAGTGVASLRLTGIRRLLGLSAAHLGAAGTVSIFYLLCLARVYSLSDTAARALVSACVFGTNGGGIIEQQFAGTWWRSALAHLPAAQVRTLNRISERSLARARRKSGVSAAASALPAGIGFGAGFSGGRIAANRVVCAAAQHLGRPPATFA